MKKIKALITRYKPSLADLEYKYLRHNYFETTNFYRRPKLNKSEILHKAIKEQNKELITISEPKDLKPRPVKDRLEERVIFRCNFRTFNETRQKQHQR